MKKLSPHKSKNSVQALEKVLHTPTVNREHLLAVLKKALIEDLFSTTRHKK
jgi:hypothetical protein